MAGLFFLCCLIAGTAAVQTPGPQGAKAMKTLVVFAFTSGKATDEIAEYPDSGKFGVLGEFPAEAGGKPPTFRFVGRESNNVPYWDGE
jgi:hypothetical protein